MRLLLLLVLVVGANIAYAQPPDYREVVIRASADVDELWCKPAGGGYDRLFEFRANRKEQCEAEIAELKPDFDRQRLIHWSVGGDCHMKAAVKVFRSDAERRVRVVVNKLYGGCRAAGWKAGALTIDKPPSAYRVSVEEVGVNEHEQTSFIFPPPLPTVRIETIPHRRIDLNECFPLTGESRWMILSDEHLDRNLAGQPHEKACLDKLSEAKVDLATSTLVGVGFFSGYCGEPDGLKLSVIKEISSDRRNYVVVKAVFNDPKPACDKWTTYPVWLVVPKIAPGYILEADTKPASRAHEPRVPPEKPIEWIER